MTNTIWNPFTFTNDYVTSIAEANASQKPVKYIMSNEGQIFEMRSTDLGDFIAPAKEVKGVEKVEVGFKLNIPKIPFKLLLQAVSFFRDVCDEFANDEAMLQYWYDTETGEFFAKCLEQTTNKVHVTFVRDEELETNPRYILVMDIHSHNNMQAFFSGTDDASEQQTRTYGVVGRLDLPIPEIKFRYSVEGTFVEVQMHDLFEMPTITRKVEFICDGVEEEVAESDLSIFYPQIDYPKEWLEIIEEGKRNARRFDGIGNAHRSGKVGSYMNHSKNREFGTSRYDKQLPAPRSWDSDVIDLTGINDDPFAAIDQLSLFGSKEALFGNPNFHLTNPHDEYELTEQNPDVPFNGGDEDVADLVEAAGFFQSQLEVVEDPETRVEALAQIADSMSMFEIKMFVDRMLELGHDQEFIEQLKDNGYKVSRS